MAKGVPKKEAVAGEAKPQGKSKKLLIIIVAAVVLLAGGGATLLLLTKKGSGAGHEEAVAHPVKAPVFVNLEPFTVNLQPENGEQYLQVVATLKVSEKSVEDNVKVYMPELRHKTLLLLSSKKASEIATPEGREQLSEDIRRATNAILNTAAGKTPRTPAATKSISKVAHTVPAAPAVSIDDPIQGVLFTSFIIQ